MEQLSYIQALGAATFQVVRGSKMALCLYAAATRLDNAMCPLIQCFTSRGYSKGPMHVRAHGQSETHELWPKRF